MNLNSMEKTLRKLKYLSVFTFVVSPVFAWGSIAASDETAVFASLSRMIWYSGSALRILIAMLVLFIPMLISFFLAHDLCNLPKVQKLTCRICMIVSCAVLYLGAMWVMPSDGNSMTSENIWHGILSFGGMLMIFLTYCIYTVFIWHKDNDGSFLLAAFLAFSLITGIFAVLNVFDEKSYVIASAVSELYVLTMMSLIGYLSCYLAYRKLKIQMSERSAAGTGDLPCPENNDFKKRTPSGIISPEDVLFQMALLLVPCF